MSRHRPIGGLQKRRSAIRETGRNAVDLAGGHIGNDDPRIRIEAYVLERDRYGPERVVQRHDGYGDARVFDFRAAEVSDRQAGRIEHGGVEELATRIDVSVKPP